MIKQVAAFIDRRVAAVALLVILLLAMIAWFNRFIQDDAFISFRYAQNLVNGNGLVWNVGERVEGYTNFLWTLLMGVPMFLDIDPVNFSCLAGIVCFIISLGFTFKLAHLMLGSRTQALLAVIFLGSNYTFSCYATGGLETQLQAALLTALLYLAFRIVHQRVFDLASLMACSFLAALALLTRLDSAIFIAVLLTLLLFLIAREKTPIKIKSARIAVLVLPCLIIVSAWFCWKAGYYGDLLPNTYYAKAGGLSFPVSVLIYKFGIKYIYFFLLSYWLIPFLLLFLLSLKRLRTKPGMTVITLIMALWLLYIIKVGGDFMEFRMMVLILPLSAVVLVWLIFHVVVQKPVQIALVAVVLLGSWSHSAWFGKTFRMPGVESIELLQGHLYGPGRSWCTIGRRLGELFHDENRPVVIATTAAGAIPYYSRLETVDMLGLNDRWIARHGRFGGIRPGHRKVATTGYLLRRKANLVLGNPTLVPDRANVKAAYRVADLKLFGLNDAKPKEIPAKARVLEIPVCEGYKLLLLYLVQNEHVGGVIRTKGFNTHPVLR